MRIKEVIEHSIAVKKMLLEDERIIGTIRQVSEHCIETFRNGGKVLWCGNGGSAADAQHLAAELSGRYYFDRDPLFSEALHVNTSYVTAVANDYSYNEIFARMIKGSGKKGDLIIGLSTSGNSANVIRAFEEAKELDMITVAFTGKSGGSMKDYCDLLINVPSEDTPRIQESHIMIGHIICEIIESTLFGNE